MTTKKATRVLGTAAVLLVASALSACSLVPQAEDGAVQPVSLETTCNQLLGIQGGGKEVLLAATDLVIVVSEAESLEGVTEGQLENSVRDLGSIAKYAPSEIKPFVDMVLSPIQDFYDVKRGAKSSLEFDTRDFITAKDEIANQCMVELVG